jgi:glucans biosynthesis protein
VEIPTADEFNDNIVAFWVPEQAPAPGEPLELDYKIHWCLDQIRPPAGFVVATRRGRSAAQQPELDRFFVDFDGPYLHAQPADPAIEPVLTVGAGGTLAQASLAKNPFNGTWRVSFGVKPDGSGRPIELRCFLRKGPHALTETWSYAWQP